jgi:hypothetical protein
MAPSVKISRKTAMGLLGFSTLALLKPAEERLFRELHAAIKASGPKKFVKAARKVKRAKKATKKEETAEIWAQVMARADGLCECGCGYQFGPMIVAELDHFFPKARTRQSVATCWALTSACHRLKTRNEPSAEDWLCKFIGHAERHEYAGAEMMARGRLQALETMAAVGT